MSDKQQSELYKLSKRKQLDQELYQSLTDNAESLRLFLIHGVAHLCECSEGIPNFSLCSQVEISTFEQSIYLDPPKIFQIENNSIRIEKIQVSGLSYFEKYLLARRTLSYPNLFSFIKDTGLTLNEAIGFL